MKKEHKTLTIIIAAYTILRIWLATQSSYGYYHGWNEGYYSLIAKNYFTGSLWNPHAYPDGAMFTSAPPLFSYTVYAYFNLFGISDLSARLVSITAELITITGIYLLTKELHNEKTAYTASIIFIMIPWNILWYGRAQTDPLMTALMTLGIALYTHAYKHNKTMLPAGITLGLAIFTKQPALAALPILLLWSHTQGIRKNKLIQFTASLLIGLLPLIIWITYHTLQGNPVIESLFYNELTHRSAPFEDLTRVTATTAISITPLILALATYTLIKPRKTNNTLPIIWLLTYGTFVAIRTPLSHEYYSLPLIPPITILAATGITKITQNHNIKHTTLLLILLITTTPLTYTLLNTTGDINYTGTKNTAEYINKFNHKTLLFVPVKYTPQLYWYTHNTTIYSIGEQNLTELENILEDYSADSVFVLLDNMDDRSGQAGRIYKNVYTYEYHFYFGDLNFAPDKMTLYKI